MSKSETDKRIERGTRKIIEDELRAAQLYLGRPGSQSRGNGPVYKRLAKKEEQN